MFSKRFSYRSEIVINLTILSIVASLLLGYLMIRRVTSTLIYNQTHAIVRLLDSHALDQHDWRDQAWLATEFGREVDEVSVLDKERGLALWNSYSAVQSSTRVRVKNMQGYRLGIGMSSAPAEFLMKIPRQEGAAYVLARSSLPMVHSQINQLKILIFAFALIYALLLAPFAYFVLAKVVARLEDLNTQLQDAHNELIRKEKLAAVGRLGAGLAHEIGNPLGSIIGYIDIVRNEVSDKERGQLIDRIERELLRIRSIIGGLLDFSKPKRVNMKTFDPASVVETALQRALDPHRLPKELHDVYIERSMESGRKIRIDPDQLEQVVLNLLINACHALQEVPPDRHRIGLKLYGSEEEGKRYVRIDVEDCGPGIALDDQARVFDPFYTTKEPGEGTGLGLYVSSSIIDAWGGMMKVDSTPNKSTRFSVLLPDVS